METSASFEARYAPSLYPTVGPQETGMQHTEEANLCTEVSRMASDFEKGFGTGAEQKIVEDLLVLQNQWRQVAGECEDHVQVAGRE